MVSLLVFSRCNSHDPLKITVEIPQGAKAAQIRDLRNILVAVRKQITGEIDAISIDDLGKGKMEKLINHNRHIPIMVAKRL